MSIASKVIGLLQGVFQLFPLGGANGGIAIKSKAGVQNASIDGAGVVTGTTLSGGTTLTSFVVSPGGWTGRTDTGVAVGLGFSFCFCSGTTVGLAIDTTLNRLTAGVVGIGTGVGTGVGWLQNTAGRARLTADVTNVTTTLANLADLTITVKAGRTYTGRLVLPIDEGLAADGFKLSLNGGTATMTAIEYGFSSAIGATLGTRTSTALATAITLTALTDTADVFVEIPVMLTVNAAGTIIPQQAKNADAAGGTLTIRRGGYFWLEDTP